jgi:hypothetical protein
MGAALSSAAIADAVRAAKNCAQRKLIAQDGAADEKNDYWSALPDDLLLTILAALDVPDLRRCGAVCKSWRHAYDAFRLPALEKAPCLLYACEEYGPNDLALYCPTTDATFRVPFPGQPHFKRGFTFSCPGGWVFTTDEVGDPYLINPLTGVQAALPPVSTIDGMAGYITWARHTAYLRVAISGATKMTECVVLIAHTPSNRLSFARPGDKRWTLLSERTRTVSDILYNDNVGLFYILYARGSISTLDLSGPSPSTATILPRMISRNFCDMYLALGPAGEVLQVWRNKVRTDLPRKFHISYENIVNGACQHCVEFAGEDDNDGSLRELEINENEDTFYDYDDVTADDEIDALLLLREGIDIPHRLVDEVTTIEILVFKVDIERQMLVELRDIGDYALFLGSNSAVCLPTKDFPVFKPNCAYLTDDCQLFCPMLRKDLVIWNIKTRSMQKLADAWPNLHSWLHVPAPLWIMPRF